MLFSEARLNIFLNLENFQNFLFSFVILNLAFCLFYSFFEAFYSSLIILFHQLREKIQSF